MNATAMSIVLPLLLGACATTAPARSPANRFVQRLQQLCGQAFAGRVVSTDAADADMAGKRLVMHVRTCGPDEVRIPFHVGDNRSRTWVLRIDRIVLTSADRRSRSGEETGSWLVLKHDHRHADGSPDVLTNYGGESFGGSSTWHSFPADDFSKDLFRTKGNPASVANIWAMEIVRGRSFAYELRRPGRFFRVEFDLTKPVALPPPPWGAS